MSHSQRRGVITVSFKKGDSLNVSTPNWRPITQLNVDYKIASHSISAPLLKVLHFLFGTDESCGVPGQFIAECCFYP